MFMELNSEEIMEKSAALNVGFSKASGDVVIIHGCRFTR